MEKHLNFMAPKYSAMKEKSTVSSFTETMEETDTSINVCQIISLPPFIANAINTSGDTNAALIGIIFISAIEAKRALVGENYNYSDLDEVAQHTSGWHWLEASSLLARTSHTMPSSSAFSSWHQNLHSIHSRR